MEEKLYTQSEVDRAVARAVARVVEAKDQQIHALISVAEQSVVAAINVLKEHDLWSVHNPQALEVVCCYNVLTKCVAEHGVTVALVDAFSYPQCPNTCSSDGPQPQGSTHVDRQVCHQFGVGDTAATFSEHRGLRTNEGLHLGGSQGHSDCGRNTREMDQHNWYIVRAMPGTDKL